ncbi:hypothetical protein CWI38_2422p0010, partial [Hamiltosporidium tvaerminnensis]
MLLQLLDCLEKSKEISTRRAAILKVENNNKTHLALIKGFLKVKYRLVEEVTKKSLEEAQLAKLYNEIEKRKLHSKLYNARNNELECVSDSSRWLKRGNIRPRNEAVFCYIQDRNVFLGADGVCQHYGKSGKTVDHLATRCEKMLGHDYTRWHNEVVRCLHLLLLNRYKFKSSKRIRSHSVQEILDNEYAEIRVDIGIKTDVKIRRNRSDIFILDKKKNKITLIEEGITSQDSLQIVESEKLRQYDLLANELGLIYKCSVVIIPYVMTWDGIVTKYHKSHLKRLEIPNKLLKETVETISFDRRRGLESGLNDKESGERASMGVIMRAEMHEPTINIKEVSDLEEETEGVKEKNVSSEISNNTKIKAANDADEVKKSDSEIQKCKLHPPAIPLPSSSYTTITPPPPSQTCSKMQNSGLDTLPSPNAPVPSSVEVSACEPSYDMTSPCTLAIPEGNRLMALRTIFDSVTADPKEWPRIVFFAVQTRFERMPRNGWTELHRYYNEKFG